MYELLLCILLSWCWFLYFIKKINYTHLRDILSFIFFSSYTYKWPLNMISMHKLAIISIPTETSAIKKIINLLSESETTLPFPENTWNLYFFLKPRSALNLYSLYDFIAFFEIFGWINLFSWGRWFVIKRTTCWVIRPPFLSLFGNHSCH